MDIVDLSAAREPRSQALDRGGESRARSLGRSQSRGRTNPSDLLARKQQLLLATGVSSGGGGGGGGGGPDSSTSSGDQHPSLINGNRTAPNDSSVEAKLESLSELLKSHQNDSGGGHHHAQVQTPTGSSSSSKSIDDVYILLAKKEKDLQLAAELGKVLLEKNDELSKANERITENYSHKLELLEQDKHKLKRKLDLLDSEYENRLIELQTDCNILKNQLDEQQQVARQMEKEKSKLIDDLVQQNQRLTSELVEATKSEELLSSQLERMNERLNNGMSNRQDHVAQLDTLKEEIQIVNQRKLDLERRLKLANNDKSNLAAALDESGDKILLLEKLLNEKDAKLMELACEVNELRDSSSWLSNELESMLSLNERLVSETASGQQQQQPDGIHIGGGVNGGSSEMQIVSQRKRSQLMEQLRELRLKNRSRMRAREFKLMASSRRGDGALVAASGAASDASRHRNRKLAAGQRYKRRRQLADAAAAAGSSSLFDEIESSNRWSQDEEDSHDNEDDEDDDDDDVVDNPSFRVDGDMRTDQIVAEIYTLLHRFHTNLLLRKEELMLTSGQRPSHTSQQQQQHLYSAPNSPDDSGISADDGDDKTRRLDQVAWRRMLGSLKTLIEEMPCSNCRLMIAERSDYEQLKRLHAKLSDEMRRKDDQLLALSVAKTEQETRLAALEERCAILGQDLSNCDKPKEEIVKLAWRARDEAVERKNAAEISLAKTRIENMQISSQLMEVVQQKGELSQRLAQFEDDIHYITQDSVKAKFTWEEYAEKLRRSKANQQDTTTTSTTSSSNPLVQLLGGFSVTTTTPAASSYLSARNNGSPNQAGANGNGNGTTRGSQQDKSSAMDNPASLMRNFTSNRFNLRFWQRSSNDKVVATTNQADNKTGGPLIAANFNATAANTNNNSNGNGNNNHTMAAEQRAS